MVTTVQTITDVKDFIKQLVQEGTNVHPDEDFHNYVNMQTGEPAYSEKEALLRNCMMNQCFQLCEMAGENLYDVTQEIFLTETGLDRYIPLPSQIK